MTTTKPYGYWQRNAQLLRDQAKTMTCKELATAHDATPKQIRHQLHLLKTTCKSAKLARHEHLSELCKKQLSVRQIAELEGKTTSAIYQELKLHGLSTINTQLRWTEAAIAELIEQAQTRTAAELAALRQFELKYMYKLLRRFGIKTRPHRTVVPRSPKAQGGTQAAHRCRIHARAAQASAAGLCTATAQAPARNHLARPRAGAAHHHPHSRQRAHVRQHQPQTTGAGQKLLQRPTGHLTHTHHATQQAHPRPAGHYRPGQRRQRHTGPAAGHPLRRPHHGL